MEEAGIIHSSHTRRRRRHTSSTNRLLTRMATSPIHPSISRRNISSHISRWMEIDPAVVVSKAGGGAGINRFHVNLLPRISPKNKPLRNIR